MIDKLMLRIVLVKPPIGVDFALQKGHGINFEIVDRKRSEGENLFFDFTVIVKKGKDGLPRFSGLFVQGPSSLKFIYIGIGIFAGQAGSCWSRRLKIPLTGITLPIRDSVNEKEHVQFETYVQATAKDGTPACATIKPFNGWKLC